MSAIAVQRQPGQHGRTSYRLEDSDGSYLDSLTFRDVMALVAADAGRVRARWRRTYSPWFADRYLVPECDDHGIGYGTLTGLQSRFGRPGMIESCGDDEGPLGLTDHGRAVLAEIRALVGEVGRS